MDGYHLTKDVSDAVVNGSPRPEISSQEELRAIMAVQGDPRRPQQASGGLREDQRIGDEPATMLAHRLNRHGRVVARRSLQ